MKFVNLKGPAVVEGVVRYPTEGDILVSDAEAQRLKDNGFLAPDPVEEEDETDGLDGMTVVDLKTLAGNESVDLGTASVKADIIAAIRQHRAANA